MALVTIVPLLVIAFSVELQFISLETSLVSVPGEAKTHFHAYGSAFCYISGDIDIIAHTIMITTIIPKLIGIVWNSDSYCITNNTRSISIF